jgi:hypothetical protein
MQRYFSLNRGNIKGRSICTSQGIKGSMIRLTDTVHIKKIKGGRGWQTRTGGKNILKLLKIILKIHIMLLILLIILLVL